MKISDEELEERLKEQLRWDDRINDIKIYISIKDGNVKFDGSISSYYAKKLVTKNVKKINGVKSVENNLRVNYAIISDSELPSDEELRNNIEQTLNLSVNIYNSKISVKVNKGIVTLNGTVDTYWKKDIVESIVSGFIGVSNIVNNLEIIHFDHKDEQIAKEITATLHRYRKVNVDDINIVVEKGKVSISGKVSDWEEINAILDTIHYTHGVREINNNLIIESI